MAMLLFIKHMSIPHMNFGEENVKMIDGKLSRIIRLNVQSTPNLDIQFHMAEAREYAYYGTYSSTILKEYFFNNNLYK